ncbi:hypothetical protein HPULCUR_007130 [Helicostylum pulchrum]|uniref:F-box domain-containing protein n=1 Tax=Helicostylum pulchrum TaxID=562976 RepID=A0ABP9Y526_9FUNG
MEKLSKETFLTIISHLDSCQKIKCVLVCKQWEQWIRNTILYRDVNVYSCEMFIEAMELFSDNKNYSTQVQKLRIYDCQPDTYLMLALPEIFVNLKKLIWVSHKPLEVEFPRKPIYIQQFQNWNALEDIHCYSKDYDHVALYTLESSVLPRLTKLKMHVENSTTEPETPTLYVQKLFTCLKNAPALTELILGNLSASLSDLNMIHVNTPSLQTLSLPEFFLDNLDGPVTFTLPSNLVNFSVDLQLERYEDMEEKNMTKTIKALLSHVAIKYPVLKTLCIDFSDHLKPILVIGSLEVDIIHTIRALPCLTSYTIRVCPITDMILEAMDSTQIKLEEMKIWLHEFDARRQLKFLLYSKQANSISRLTIIDKVTSKRSLPINIPIFNLVTILKNVTELELRAEPETTTYNYSFLIEIVDQLNNLETLCIHNICDDQREVPVALSTYQPKKSKITCLQIRLVGNMHRHRYTNAMFKFIFQSCPTLKTFRLNGSVHFDHFACLSLDLSRHRLLEIVDIALSDVAYYTRDKKKPNVPCVKYRDSREELKLRAYERIQETFYIELLCETRTIFYLGYAHMDYLSDYEFGSNDESDDIFRV